MSREISHVYEFDAFRLDPAERQLLRDGQPVSLTPKAFEALVVLVERGGHLVEKDELLNLVWAEAFVEEANLARCVHTLRKALGEEHNGHQYIETVPKRGYRFVAEVREIENGAATLGDAQAQTRGRSETATPDVQPMPPPDNEAANDFAPSPRRVTPRRTVFIVSLALVVAAAAVGAYFYSNRSRPVAIDKTPINSIAVLPFVNVGADPEVEYLSDGLSESVIDRLSQLPQLKVIARSSSFKYRGQNLDLQEVANALGVQTIVTGRVEPRGDNLIVRTELIDVRENRQLWSESYNRRATDVQAVQGEIAQTVSEKLRLRLTGAQEQQLAKTATANPEAYQLYLTGLFVSRTSSKNSLDYFRQATILDPNFALAFYRVSWCYFCLGYNGEIDPKETVPKARAALQRALELDDTLAEAHQLLVEIKRSEWDWTGAENESNRVIELNPNTAIAHQLNAKRLANAGRIEEAAVESRLAQALDLLAIPPKILEGMIFLDARRFDEARAKFEQIVKLAPDSGLAHVWLGYAYAAKGMYREAIAEYQQSLKLQGDNTSDQCYLGYALAKSGKRNEALAILNKLKTMKEYVSPFELAAIYIGLGDKEAAFQSLERAYAAHDLQLQSLKSDSTYDDLHDDPRFQELLRRVGLPQ